MRVTIDLSAASRLLSDEDFRDWAASQTVFLSSVMAELAAERRRVAAALEQAGFTVRWFEEFGGRDDPPDVAYLSEVDAADIYVGILADDYGAMQSSGFSATHEEYNEARDQGKRVSFWVRADGVSRQGNARRFLEEVQVFNTTGSFTTAEDLADKLLRRLREMAAEDVSPWVKLGDIVFRATSIVETGNELRLEARVRDQAVLDGLRVLGPDTRWGRNQTAPITYSSRSGQGRLTDLAIRMQASSSQDVTLTLAVEWPNTRPQNAMNYNGVAHEDLVEASIRVGLLREDVPAQMAQMFRPFGGMTMSSVIDERDPLEEMQRVRVPEGSVEAISRLLVTEQLVGGQKVATIDSFRLGPAIRGRRRIRLEWREYPAYTNRPAGHRQLDGERGWG